MVVGLRGGEAFYSLMLESQSVSGSVSPGLGPSQVFLSPPTPWLAFCETRLEVAGGR